jgi:hypothetical protein
MQNPLIILRHWRGDYCRFRQRRQQVNGPKGGLLAQDREGLCPNRVVTICFMVLREKETVTLQLFRCGFLTKEGKRRLHGGFYFLTDGGAL